MGRPRWWVVDERSFAALGLRVIGFNSCRVDDSYRNRFPAQVADATNTGLNDLIPLGLFRGVALERRR
jgi:hypothetical protein